MADLRTQNLGAEHGLTYLAEPTHLIENGPVWKRLPEDTDATSKVVRQEPRPWNGWGRLFSLQVNAN
jgi:hypothetical protein